MAHTITKIVTQEQYDRYIEGIPLVWSVDACFGSGGGGAVGISYTEPHPASGFILIHGSEARCVECPNSPFPLLSVATGLIGQDFIVPSHVAEQMDVKLTRTICRWRKMSVDLVINPSGPTSQLAVAVARLFGVDFLELSEVISDISSLRDLKNRGQTFGESMILAKRNEVPFSRDEVSAILHVCDVLKSYYMLTNDYKLPVSYEFNTQFAALL